MSEAPYPPRPFVPASLMAMTGWVVVGNFVLRGFVGALALGGVLAVATCALGFLWLLIELGDRLRRDGVCESSAYSAAEQDHPSPTDRPQRRVAMAGVVCLLMLASCVLAGRSLARTDAFAREVAEASISSASLTVASDPSKTETGWFCRADVVTQAGSTGSVWLSSPEPVTFGERMRVVGRFSPNEEDEWGTTSRARGVSGRIRSVKVLERQPASGLVGALGRLRGWVVGRIEPERGEARALMAGVIAADRSQLKAQGTEDVFATVGLSHLVAVSGSHLVVVGAGLEALLVALGASFRVRALGVMAIAGLYVMFCANPASAVRSWVMLGAGLLGRGLGRRSHAPSSVALAGIAMCALDPTCACDLGFVLSVLSVCALALFSSHAEALLACLVTPASSGVVTETRRRVLARLPSCARRALRPVRGLVRAARSTFAASLVCQMATLPACAVTFGRVSLLAPVANVVVGPLFGPIVSVGVVGSTLSWVPLVGESLLFVTEVLCSLAVWLARLLASLPYASIPVELEPVWELAPVALAVAWLATWPCPTKGQLTLVGGLGVVGCICVVLWGVVLVTPRVVVLDVGQGDAILIRDGPRAVLVDTGPDDAVVAALARQHVYALDAVIITHLHDDHTGGLDALPGLVSVATVYIGEGVSDDLPAPVADPVAALVCGPADVPSAGDELGVGGFTLSCLWPTEPTTGAENEDSLCLALSYDSDAVALEGLLTGDAESSVLQEVAPACGDIDLLKVGHHGSRISIAREQAALLAPEVAVASAGEGNSYGHPTPECREVLSDAGAMFLSTIESGDVTVEPGELGPKVSCQRVSVP